MRQRFVAAPGVSLRGIGLQTGRTAGIEIDNPSGSWLYIPTLETWVPPYTLGWSQAFPYGVASCDVVAGNGPSGQVGTNQGDGITVYLTDEQVASSPGEIATGAGFIEGFTPVLSASIGVQVPQSSGVQGTIVASPGANKRIRLLSWDATNANTDPFSVQTSDSPLTFALGDFTAVRMTWRLTVEKGSDGRTYPNGIDLDKGSSLDYIVQSNWADGFAEITVTYQVI